MWMKRVASFFYTTSDSPSWLNHLASLKRSKNFVPEGNHYWCIVSGDSYFANELSDLLPIVLDIDLTRFHSVNFSFNEKNNSNLRLTEIGYDDMYYNVKYEGLEDFFKNFKGTLGDL